MRAIDNYGLLMSRYNATHATILFETHFSLSGNPLMDQVDPFGRSTKMLYLLLKKVLQIPAPTWKDVELTVFR